MNKVKIYPINTDIKETIKKFYDCDKSFISTIVKENFTDGIIKLYATKGINCNVKSAYKRMTTSQLHFGKNKGTFAYLAVQYFNENEISQYNNAYNVALNTIYKLWKNNYECILFIHFCGDKIYNHILINSVSFTSGKRFMNTLSEQYIFQKISLDCLLDLYDTE